MDEMLTYEEVSARLKCSVRSVRLLVQKKRLPVVIISHKIRRVPSSGVEALLRGETPAA